MVECDCEKGGHPSLKCQQKCVRKRKGVQRGLKALAQTAARAATRSILERIRRGFKR